MKFTMMVALGLLVAVGGTIRAETEEAVIDMPRGVLIIYGRGMIPDYKHALMSSIMKGLCRTFAETVHAALDRHGVPGAVYDGDGADPIRYFAGELKRTMRDGVLQIIVTHDVRDDQSDIVLRAELLHLRDNPEHRTVLFSSSPIVKRYVLFSGAWADDEALPIGDMALDFVSHLIAAGGLDRSQGVFEEHARHYARPNAQHLDLPLPEFWFSFTNEPFVNPRIVQELTGWLSDFGDQVVAINLLESQKSNRYHGDFEHWHNERARELWGAGPLVGYHDPESEISFSYIHIGTTDSGVHVLHTAENTGGSMTYKQLLFLTVEPDMGVDHDWDWNEPTVRRTRPRLLLKILGRIGLGDRWVGELRVEGNELFVGKDVGLFGGREVGGILSADPRDRVLVLDF